MCLAMITIHQMGKFSTHLYFSYFTFEEEILITDIFICSTGVRDYIHVVDLAKGHVSALDKLYSDEVGCEAVNLGTGNGISVLQLVEGMSKATGKAVPYEIAPRRPGDVASVYADPKRAEELLGWKATLGQKEMCEDTWRWQSNNPLGYKEEIIQQN